MQMKKMGDDNIKERKFGRAVEYYSMAIDSIVDISEVEKMLSNRSYSNLMNNDATSACKDAECCIIRNPNWSKGYYRKGVYPLLHSSVDNI
jgi:hypothetical protein